jgi:hypothetical protein
MVEVAASPALVYELSARDAALAGPYLAPVTLAHCSSAAVCAVCRKLLALIFSCSSRLARYAASAERVLSSRRLST